MQQHTRCKHTTHLRTGKRYIMTLVWVHDPRYVVRGSGGIFLRALQSNTENVQTGTLEEILATHIPRLYHKVAIVNNKNVDIFTPHLALPRIQI